MRILAKIVFVLGGAKSGKSRFACELAGKWGSEVAYVATCLPLDEEMRKKIEEHKKRRPPGWQTIEEDEDLVSALKQAGGRVVVIIDCLTLLISNLLLKGVGGEDILGHIERFIEGARKQEKKSILVSNEVGMGIVPDNKLARQFREVSGRVSQMVTETSDEAYLLVAGQPIKIK